MRLAKTGAALGEPSHACRAELRIWMAKKCLEVVAELEDISADLRRNTQMLRIKRVLRELSIGRPLCAPPNYGDHVGHNHCGHSGFANQPGRTPQLGSWLTTTTTRRLRCSKKSASARWERRGFSSLVSRNPPTFRSMDIRTLVWHGPGNRKRATSRTPV